MYGKGGLPPLAKKEDLGISHPVKYSKYQEVRLCTEFEPSRLTSFYRCIVRHLRDHEKPYCLLNDIEFSKSRVTLESKRKQLRQDGKRPPSNKLGLRESETEKRWSTNQLREHCLEALICTVWLYNTMHFVWRARDERRRFWLGDLEL